MRETIREKAGRYLLEGRVRIRSCDEENGIIEADIRGLGAMYSTGRDSAGWHCDCNARTADCAHVIALKTVIAFEPREVSF
jgi:hypothetical protein